MLTLLLALVVGPPAQARAPRYTAPSRVQCPLTLHGEPGDFIVTDARGRRVTAYGFARAVGDDEMLLRIDAETNKRIATGAILVTVGGIALAAWSVSGALTTSVKGDHGRNLAVSTAVGAANATPFLAVGVGVLASPRRLRPDSYWTIDEAEWLRHDCTQSATALSR